MRRKKIQQAARRKADDRKSAAEAAKRAKITPELTAEIKAVKDAIAAAKPGKYRRGLQTKLKGLENGSIQVEAKHDEL